MRKAARTLSLTIALATVLGACQAVPTGNPGSFATLARKSSPKPAAPKQPVRPNPPPSKPAPVTERPTPKPPSKPDHPKRKPAEPRPNPGVTPNPYYPGHPGDWNDPDRYDRQRRDVRITRVWTEDVGSDRLTVHWTTDQPTVGMVQWGTADFDDHSDWETTPDTYHAVVVPDLMPDTEYRFRVMARAVGGAGVWSPELRERTAP